MKPGKHVKLRYPNNPTDLTAAHAVGWDGLTPTPIESIQRRRAGRVATLMFADGDDDIQELELPLNRLTRAP